jgi:asparagine synthase (glutamine-hydrolysing)
VRTAHSEIAVHLYREHGMQAATLLRGEFAMVIADERQREMIAIRDRFGVKPLYYAVVNGDVFFASEIKALLALGVPAGWDLEGATGGIGRSHEKTEFAGISTVPPGCYAIARDGDVRIYPYWDWEMPTAEQMRADARSDAEIVDEFREVLRDAVRQRLVADVEVASYLSGGIDSCAVLGLAQQEMDRPLVFAFTMASFIFSDLRVLGQIGTTIALGLLFDTLIVRSFMTPSIAALLGRWFWWPVRVRQRPVPQKFGDESTRQLSLF